VNAMQWLDEVRMRGARHRKENRLNIERVEEILLVVLKRVAAFKRRRLRPPRDRLILWRVHLLHRRLRNQLYHCGGKPGGREFLEEISQLIQRLLEGES